MFKILNTARYTEKAVFLAMDRVYDKEGNPHDEKTQLYVPNSYIIQLAKEHNKILFGASVHPYRPDWEQELNYCLDNRAVLCKWIPSSQLINPANETCIPFYKKLAQSNLPLLCHAGPEYAIPNSYLYSVAYNNPRCLRTALDVGVTIIIAHCATPYWGAIDVDYQDDFDELLRLFREADLKGWKLYADLSAICTPFRSPYIKQVQAEISSNRLIYASDYPIPISAIGYKNKQNYISLIGSIVRSALTNNQLDKNYLLIKEMGFGDGIFFNAAGLFKKIKYS